MRIATKRARLETGWGRAWQRERAGYMTGRTNNHEASCLGFALHAREAGRKAQPRVGILRATLMPPGPSRREARINPVEREAEIPLVSSGSNAQDFAFR
jgi:hypothetical protein